MLCEGKALAPETRRPPNLVVSRLRLGGHFTQLHDGAGQLAAENCCMTKEKATHSVSWTRRRSRLRDHDLLRPPHVPRDVTRTQRAPRLLGEYLAEPPLSSRARARTIASAKHPRATAK